MSYKNAPPLKTKKILAYVINVDWYFNLHWINRAMALKKLGYQIVVIASFNTPEHKEKFIKLGFQCIHWQLSRSSLGIFKEWKSYRKLKVILTQLKPDLIHSITIKPNIYAGLIAKKMSIPCIKSVTGLGTVFSSKQLIFRLIRPFVIFLYHMSSGSGAYVFENKDDQALFRFFKIGKYEASLCIAGAGVDINEFKAPIVSLQEKPLIILFAARLLRDKGLEITLRAIQQLKQNGRHVELWVAGLLDSESKGAYSEEDILRLSQTYKFKWLGLRNDMNDLLKQVHIVVLPTRYGEGIPRVLIEAGACGRLVITSNVSGCRDLILNKKDGLIVSNYDYQDMSNQIESIFETPKIYEVMAFNLQNKVHSFYSDKVVISRFVNLYQTLIKE